MKTLIEDKLDEFLNYLKVKNYSTLTCKTYKQNLKEAINIVEIWEENSTIFIDIMPYRIFIKNKNKRTIYKKISILKSYISYLKKIGYEIILRNDEVRAPKRTLPKPISHDFILACLKYANYEQKLIITLIYTLGLRIHELENLKLSDIKNDWVIIKAKGGKIKQIPLLKEVKTVLDEYIKKYEPKVYILEKDGKKYSSSQLRYRVSKAFKDIGLKVTPHQLRHSFATELLSNGAKIFDVSKLLGHETLEATQIYTKLSTSLKEKNYKLAHPLANKGTSLV